MSGGWTHDDITPEQERILDAEERAARAEAELAQMKEDHAQLQQDFDELVPELARVKAERNALAKQINEARVIASELLAWVKTGAI